jgi:hypothetical protein
VVIHIEPSRREIGGYEPPQGIPFDPCIAPKSMLPHGITAQNRRKILWVLNLQISPADLLCKRLTKNRLLFYSEAPNPLD